MNETAKILDVQPLEMERLCACLSPLAFASPLMEEVSNWARMDWSRFFELAINHHVIPKVYQTVKALAARSDVIPDPWLDHLQSLYLSIASHNHRAISLLVRLQSRLASAGIEAIPVKGPSLALLAYGDLSLRQFEDLDLLVHQADLLRAVELLEDTGYTLRELSPETSRVRVLDSLQNWSLHKLGWPPIDLKSVVASHTLSRPEDLQFMAKACRPMDIGDGRQLVAPGPEAMLLAVCLDGANEMWFKLSSVADVAALLTTFPNVGWAQLLQDAARMGHRRSLVVGVQVANLLLGCTLPPEFREAVRKDRVARKLARQTSAWIRSCPPRHTAILRQSWFGFLTRERLRDRFRFVWRLLFVPGPFELNAMPLPDCLYPLYAFGRPLRLAWDVWVRGGRHRRLSLDSSIDPVLRKAASE